MCKPQNQGLITTCFLFSFQQLICLFIELQHSISVSGVCCFYECRSIKTLHEENEFDNWKDLTCFLNIALTVFLLCSLFVGICRWNCHWDCWCKWNKRTGISTRKFGWWWVVQFVHVLTFIAIVGPGTCSQ